MLGSMHLHLKGINLTQYFTICWCNPCFMKCITLINTLQHVCVCVTHVVRLLLNVYLLLMALFVGLNMLTNHYIDYMHNMHRQKGMYAFKYFNNKTL